MTLPAAGRNNEEDNMRKINGMMKAAVALILAGSMVFANSVPAQASNLYCDGDTPADFENYVKGADGVVIRSSIRTTFLTPEFGATLCPITPYTEFDKETGKDKSNYIGARSEMYMLPAELTDKRIEFLKNAEQGLGVKRVGFTSLYLFLNEGYLIPVQTTSKLMQFRAGLDKSMVDKDREFILIELNWAGEPTYYLDIDDDNYTVTFATNDFSGYNLYALEYAPRGSFATLEAEINQGLKKGVTRQTVINEAIAELLKAQQQ